MLIRTSKSKRLKPLKARAFMRVLIKFTEVEQLISIRFQINKLVNLQRWKVSYQDKY
jgi:hypothetical protein